MFVSMRDIIPEGKKGIASVEHFTLKRGYSGSKYYIPKGEYCRLVVGGAVVMSDTPDEYQSNRNFIHRASGDVLVAGLGLGAILVPIIDREEIRSITVVEVSEDVIDLVYPHIKKLDKNNKIMIINEDIFNFAPDKIWDVIYFDIWPYIVSDNYEQMKKLHRKFCKRYTTWMDSWNKDVCKQLVVRNRRERDKLSWEFLKRL
jgi:hypothetical protein